MTHARSAPCCLQAGANWRKQGDADVVGMVQALGEVVG